MNDYKNSKNFTDFLELYTNSPERVIFFVGAGLSMPLFPSWSAFLKELVNDTNSSGKLGFDIKELLEKIETGNNFLEIADYCAEAIGKSEYRNIIEKHFDKDFDYHNIPKAYQRLLTLQFKGIITTNYDRIPEIGGKGKFNCYTNKSVPEALRAMERGKNIVLKIHGDILNQDSIILTESDFKSVMHDQTIQNGLRSLFSTSTICFLGFGLSDPHFKLILDYLNTVNNENSITHYAFLTSKSKFEINALEKKNGIRIIEYTSSDNSHPEVVEFISELSGIKSISQPKQKINSGSQLLELLESKLQLEVGIQHYYISYSEATKKLSINYFTRANTEYEQQKEILSIHQVFAFETDLINSIETSGFTQTNPTIEYVKACPIILVSTCMYEDAFKFSSGHLSKDRFWTQLKFNQPFMIGNLHFTDRKVSFPFMNY